MAIHKTTINGYEVELETEIDDDPSTQCFVEKGNYSASLSCLAHTGELMNSSDQPKVVPNRTIEQIEKWADSKGY